MPHVPQLQRLLTSATSLLPLWPLELVVSRLAIQIARGRPGLLDRLGEHAEKTVAVAPTDIDVVFLMKLGPHEPSVKATRIAEPGSFDARVSGPLLALIDLVEGRMDGDALFFSRKIAIDGDMETVVALRNALDAEGLDLIEEAARPFGPLGSGMSRIGHGALDLLRSHLPGLTTDRTAS